MQLHPHHLLGVQGLPSLSLSGERGVQVLVSLQGVPVPSSLPLLGGGGVHVSTPLSLLGGGCAHVCTSLGAGGARTSPSAPISCRRCLSPHSHLGASRDVCVHPLKRRETGVWDVGTRASLPAPKWGPFRGRGVPVPPPPSPLGAGAPPRSQPRPCRAALPGPDGASGARTMPL